MTVKTSTGLRNKLLDGNPLKTILAAGFIDIYTSPEPASADDAATGTKLCRLSIASGGPGVNFAAAASGGSISKAAAETWSGVNRASGTAYYFRHVAAGDTAALSTTEARIQGDVAVAGGVLNLSSVSLTSGATQAVDYYNVAIPAS